MHKILLSLVLAELGTLAQVMVLVQIGSRSTGKHQGYSKPDRRFEPCTPRLGAWLRPVVIDGSTKVNGMLLEKVE